MADEAPRLKDLVTILYRPRATVRRILASSHRWTSEIIVLACICSSLPDKDVRSLNMALPDLGLTSSLALVLLVVILGAVIWLLGVYVFSWMVALAAKSIGGAGEISDVRAALAWSLVPLIWSAFPRIAETLYLRRFSMEHVQLQDSQALLEFIKQGGCTLAVVVISFKIVIFVWTLFIASAAVGEALHLSTAEGLGAISLAAAAPVVIGVAAALSLNG